jgi:KDO2-lipid IV(A) lauroyltransferase
MASLSADKIREIVTLEGLENIRQSVSSQNGVLYFTAHLANWEMGPRIFSDLGYPVSIVYRKGNNPWIGSLIQKMRSSYLVSAIPKGKTGSREIMKRLHNGERVGILVDQKMNDGIKSVFFGMEAMTAPAIARLALKFQCPVVPVRVVRQNACSFRVIVLPPLPVDRTGDTEKDTQTLIDKINKMVEEWVRERPGQWIWLHNRWPNDQ